MKKHVFLIVSIALLAGCNAPKEGEQEAANPAATTADIAWTPGENNATWNLRYRPYIEGAEDGMEGILVCADKDEAAHG